MKRKKLTRLIDEAIELMTGIRNDPSTRVKWEQAMMAYLSGGKDCVEFNNFGLTLRNAIILFFKLHYLKDGINFTSRKEIKLWPDLQRSSETSPEN